MAEITQKLGFDAQQAVSSLNSLNSALKGVNTQLNLFNKGTGPHPDTTRHFQQTAKQAQAAEAQLRKTASAFNSTGKAGQQAGNSITLSWQTMLRIVQTQVLFAALNRLISLFNDSAKAAAEFQIEVARISTIAEGPGSSVEELSASLNALSVELGRPITEVTSAAFQALQNDLGTTKETMELLGGASHELALITGGDLTQSVNAISSVLKSYNLDITQAKDISDIFFVTIDKGRITLEELQSSLGTLAPLGSQISVSFQELAASTAAITQSGTGGSTAMTQLRNVLQKLIKPTEEMEVAFKKLEVTGGRELIAKMGGLKEALIALAGTVNGDERAIAKMFGTIRGQLGVFNLLSNDAGIFTDILKDMETNAGSAKKALDTIENTDARDVDRQIQQLNKTLRDMGNTSLKVAKELLAMFSSLVPDAKTAIVAIGGVTTAIGILAATAILTSPVLAALFAPAAIVVGIAAAILGVNKLIQVIKDYGDVSKQVEQARADSLKASKKVVDETAKAEAETFKKSLEERQSLVKDYVNKVSAEYQREFGKFQEISQGIVQQSNNILNGFKESRKAVIESIKKTIQDVDDKIKDSLKTTADALQDLSDFDFDRSLTGLTKAQVAAKKYSRAVDELRTATNAAASANALNADSVDATRKAFDRALQSAKAAVEAARASGRKSDLEDALNRERDVLKGRADFEKNLTTDLTSFKKKQGEQQLADVEARTKREEQLIADLLAAQSKVDANGKLKSPEQAAKDKARAEDLKKTLANEFSKDLNVDLFKSFGVQNMITKMTLETAAALDGIDVQWTGAVQSLQAALNANPFTAKVTTSLTDGAGTGNKAVDSAIDKANSGFSPGSNPQDIAKAQIDALKQLQTENAATQKSFAEANAKVLASFDAIQQALAPSNFGTEKLSGSFREVHGEILKTASDATTATKEQLTTLASDAATQLGKVKTLLADGIIDEGTAERLTEAIKNTFQTINERLEALKVKADLEPGTAEAIQAKLQAIFTAFTPQSLGINPENANQLLKPIEEGANATFNNVQTKAAATATSIGSTFTTGSNTAKAAVAGIQPVINSLNTNSAVAQMNRLREAAIAALAAARAAAAAGGGGGQHHGGAIFRAQGGSVPGRGVDTRIVAMQPGEFVMNKKSSGKFFSQLQAMNGNQLPQFREQGGPVTNVGDINVSVNSQPGDSVSGRDIAIALRRELRRQTSKPF